MIPFAVVGSDHEYQVNGKRILGRKTKWGTIEGNRQAAGPADRSENSSRFCWPESPSGVMGLTTPTPPPPGPKRKLPFPSLENGVLCVPEPACREEKTLEGENSGVNSCEAGKSQGKRPGLMITRVPDSSHQVQTLRSTRHV